MYICLVQSVNIMAKSTFLLQSESKTAQIYIRLSLGRGKTFKKKTGFVIDSKKWSLTNKVSSKGSIINKGGFPKTTTAEGKKIKNKLLELSIFIERQLNIDNSEGVELDGEWLERQINICFNRIHINTTNYLTDWIQKYIDKAPSIKNVRNTRGLSRSRILSYKRLKTLILEFEKDHKKRLRIHDINREFEEKFIVWMEDVNSYSESYRFQAMGNIKTVCISAEGSENVELSKDLRKLESKKTSNKFIITLSIDELDKIEHAIISNDALDNARKWLLIGCNIGQRVSDLLKITDANLTKEGNDTFIELEQQKTGAMVVIPVLPKAEQLLKEGLPYPITSQVFNKHIKEVCRIAGIDTMTKGKLLNPITKRKEVGEYPKWKLITSHICRRSFATNLFSKYNASLIMSVTGHKEEATFLGYIGKTSKDYAKMLLEQVKQSESKLGKKIELPELKVETKPPVINSKSN